MPSLQTPTLRIAVRRFEPFERSLREHFENFCQGRTEPARLELQVMDLNPLEAAYFEQGRLRDGSLDLGLVNTDWLAALVRDRSLLDLNALHGTLPLADRYEAWSPSLIGPTSLDGGWWGLPFHDGPECLIYRKDLLDELDAKPPVTWSEFHELAGRLTDADAGRHGTVVAAFADGHNTVYDFCLQLWSRGGELLSAEGRPCLDQPAAAEALLFYRHLVDDGAATVPGARQIDSVKAGEIFMQGKVGMMANWFGFAAACQTVAESQVKGKVDIAPLPGGDGPGAAGGVSLNAFWMLGIAADTEQPGLAWDFARHCAGAEADRRLTLNGAVGCRLSTWADPQINEDIPFFRRLRELHEHARMLPMDTRWPALARVIESVVIGALDGEGSISDLLKMSQREADAVWGGRTDA